MLSSLGERSILGCDVGKPKKIMSINELYIAYTRALDHLCVAEQSSWSDERFAAELVQLTDRLLRRRS